MRRASSRAGTLDDWSNDASWTLTARRVADRGRDDGYRRLVATAASVARELAGDSAAERATATLRAAAATSDEGSRWVRVLRGESDDVRPGATLGAFAARHVADASGGGVPLEAIRRRLGAAGVSSYGLRTDA